MEYEFNVKMQTQLCIDWIRKWFKENGNDETKAVIGISGGKDSTVTAGLLVEALGKDRVIGVLMPNKKQADIEDSIRVVNHLGITHYTINIGSAFSALSNEIEAELSVMERTPMYDTNTPARLRMVTLYGIGAMIGNCRVANTCNLSEDKLGYSTFYGDSAGDFAPLSHLTTEEVVAIGDYLKLPEDLVHKTPSDGMCGKSDEDNLGFTYKEVNELIRLGKPGPNHTAIVRKFNANKFKVEIIRLPYYDPYLPDFLEIR